MSLPRTPGPTTSKSWEADPASPCDDIVLKPDLPLHSLASPLSALLAPKLVGGSHLPGPRSLLDGGPREPTLRRVAAARKSAGTEPLRPESTDTDPVFAILAPSRQRFTGELALDAFGSNCGTQHVLHRWISRKTAKHDAGGGRRPRPGATEWGAMRGAGEMGKDRRHLKVMTLASPR